MIFIIIFSMGFRENLKKQLVFTDMQVKELAVRSGVKKETIASYLSIRNQIPSAENAVKIARTLGVSVEFLVTGHEPAPDRSFVSLKPNLVPLVKYAIQLDAADVDLVSALAGRLMEKKN
jgi:transcriptional regulator with XRE-family HTH domain